ncbi:NADH-quinone oxidoreductase subunit NuoI [Buchnera aphidicola]|uniref:NADH-quinone oxidoreductase subunit NuoI n=1 Tax=Buchnera aphidicola TaxID=9 RepID=UPI0031B804F0
MNFKYFFYFVFTQIYSVFITLKHMFEARETLLYPEHQIYLSPRYRGRIVLTKDPDGKDRCVACNLCSVVCPVSCISVKKSQDNSGRWFAKEFYINFSRCIFCGLCEEACPTNAIQLTPDFELGDFNRQDLIYKKNELTISGVGKYPNYNFYKKCGVKLSKNDFLNVIPVNVKDLLP